MKTPIAKSISHEIARPYRCLAGFIYILQTAFPEISIFERIRKKNVDLAIKSLKKKWKKQGLEEAVTLQVDRKKNLSQEEFFKNYYKKNLPVIFDKEALYWPCMKWSLNYFQNHFPQKEIEIIESSGLVEKEFDRTNGVKEPVVVEKTTAENFINDIKNGEKKYIRFSPLMEDEETLINDLDQNWLKKMRRASFGIGYQTFIGAANRTTPIHGGSTSFFYIMADGEKKWTLFSAYSSMMLNPTRAGRVYNFTDINVKNPDLTKYPGIKYITKLECHLEKGDILFVPAWFWHEVDNLTDSWGLSYRMTSIRNFMAYPSFVFARVFFSKPSFFKIFFNAVIMKRTNKKESSIITPKIFE